MSGGERLAMVQIGLRDAQPLMGLSAPVTADDKELAFDLDSHQPASNTAMASTCAVCGNMSMAPACTSR